MLTVLDTPDLHEESTVDSLSTVPPHAQRVPTGLWQRLTQAVGRLHAGRPHRLTYAGGVSRLPLEASQERFAREQPYLYLCAYTIGGS